MSDSRASVWAGRLGRTASDPSAPGGRSRASGRLLPARPRGRALCVAVLVGAATAVLAGGTAAHAGGTPVAGCPSGIGVDVSPALADPYPVPPAEIEGGFYAHVGSYWPPATAMLCRTERAADRPVLVLGDSGCVEDAVALRVPNLIPFDYANPGTADWGTYLPPGWYTLGVPEFATAAEAPPDAPAGTVPAPPGFEIPAPPEVPTDLVAQDPLPLPLAAAVPPEVTQVDEVEPVEAWTTVCWYPTEP